MVSTPGQPDDPHQPRPALVVSEDVRNRLRDDLMMIPIFSRGRAGPTRVAVPIGTGGLRRAGVLFCEELTTIDKDTLDRGPLGGRVAGAILDQVLGAVRRALGDIVPEPQPVG
jgi:mRNA-degrading endonuclease toxin of MazEF toxin-antitoxin module